MTVTILLQFLVVLAAIWMGARFSGVGLGLWGAVGLLVLVVVFGVVPTSPPVDVMLIILAVIMAASVMDAAGGIDFLVRIAERVIRAHPRYVTIVAPLTTWTFSFLAGVGFVVVFGFFPGLRRLPGTEDPLPMPVVIEIVMLAVAAVMLLVTRVPVDEVPKTSTLRSGVVAVIGIFGLAWLGDSFIAGNKDVIVPAIGHLTEAAPWTFVLGLFFASVLLYSQAATTRALMPLGLSLGIPPQFLIGAFPSVNGYFFIPTYGSLIAAINFDRSGTTRIGKYVVNHSFMIPGLVATTTAVITGLVLAKVLF
jgi:anaerobic C4-dicarboxylate transporter